MGGTGGVMRVFGLPAVRRLYWGWVHGVGASLEDCVKAFLQPEQLSEADEWYCPKCKTHVQVGAGCYLWEGLWWCV
jgi:hypothetical protein